MPIRSWSYLTVAAISLLVAPAQAQERGELPCNDLCRSWMELKPAPRPEQTGEPMAILPAPADPVTETPVAVAPRLARLPEAHLRPSSASRSTPSDERSWRTTGRAYREHRRGAGAWRSKRESGDTPGRESRHGRRDARARPGEAQKAEVPSRDRPMPPAGTVRRTREGAAAVITPLKAVPSPAPAAVPLGGPSTDRVIDRVPARSEAPQGQPDLATRAAPTPVPSQRTAAPPPPEPLPAAAVATPEPPPAAPAPSPQLGLGGVPPPDVLEAELRAAVAAAEARSAAGRPGGGAAPEASTSPPIPVRAGPGVSEAFPTDDPETPEIPHDRAPGPRPNAG